MNPKTTIAVALATWCLLAVVSCSSQEKKKPEPETPAPAPTAQAAAPRGSSSVSMVPGEAGGVIEETITASALVTAVDAANRRVTLRSSDGTEASFTAPPEVRNLDQVRVGDKVKATIKQQLAVFVTRSGSAPGATYAEVEARAPKGARPGAMVGESYEIVAKVKAIDAAKRMATLQFADGQTRNVRVRDDVDLSRYTVGDNVVIRATQQLSVLVD